MGKIIDLGKISVDTKIYNPYNVYDMLQKGWRITKGEELFYILSLFGAYSLMELKESNLYAISDNSDIALFQYHSSKEISSISLGSKRNIDLDYIIVKDI
jgi:hypothetical protein